MTEPLIPRPTGLLLVIGDAVYAVRILDRDTVKLERDQHAYFVRKGARRVVCTCLDYIHRHAHLDDDPGCKHTRAVTVSGLFGVGEPS